MPISTAPTSDNSFFETVAELPLAGEDLLGIGFPVTAMAWLEDPRGQAKAVAEDIHELADLAGYIAETVAGGKYCFTKVHHESEDPKVDDSDAAYYVCFGGHPNHDFEVACMRLDQDWRRYSGPRSIEAGTRGILARHFPRLSGLRSVCLAFPPVILDKKDIGRRSTIYGYHSTGIVASPDPWTRLVMARHLLIASDYWGVATFVDRRGEILQWAESLPKGKLRRTGMRYLEWIAEELRGPFRPHPRPDWV
jgi:hypothetical protein